MALAWCDDELCGALFGADVDDVGLRQLTATTAGRHVVDVSAVGRGAAVTAENTRQLSGLTVARIAATSSTAAPPRHDVTLRCRPAEQHATSVTIPTDLYI